MRTPKIPTKKQRVALAEKYRRAAERIFAIKNLFCCYAIWHFGASEKELAFLFRRDGMRATGNFGMWMSDPQDDPDVSRERRILALLWAAELIEDGTVYRMMKEN